MIQTMRELNQSEIKLEELKEFKYYPNIDDQLKQPSVINKIAYLRQLLEIECCVEEPNAFWHRKQRFVNFCIINFDHFLNIFFPFEFIFFGC